MAQPTVDEILESFFVGSCDDKLPATAQRYTRVRTQLQLFLEADGWEFLTPDAAALLELERAFTPRNGFGRLFGAEDLLYALHGFLGPRWLLPGVQDRRTQVSLTRRLVQWLCSASLVDRAWHADAVRGVLAAAESARRDGA